MAMAAVWRVGHGQSVQLGAVSVLVGVLNVTPDSFSDGGRFNVADEAIAHAKAMRKEGALIIDVGGESTRPGAEPVDAATEQARVLPIIEALRAETDALISIDTYRGETARLAVQEGAHIINDVTGLQGDADMAKAVAETGSGVIIMHTGRGREKLPDVIEDQYVFLRQSLKIASDAGIADSQVVLDPGFGFAKETTEENLELMARFRELADLGLPLLAGTSRKRFLGGVTGRDAADRDVATAATSAMLRLSGADLFRVHNVAINRDALLMADAMLEMKKTLTGRSTRG
jgi:dihydropteroate synthase